MKLTIYRRYDLLLLVFLSVLLPLIANFAYASKLHIVLGMTYVLFCPGYALTAALFPGREHIDILERIALGAGLSVVVLALIGLGMNYTTWGVRLNAVLLSLAAVVVTSCGIAYYRWRRLALQDRFTLNLEFAQPQWNAMPWNHKIRLLALVLSVVILIALIRCVISSYAVKNQYTQFYILSADKTIKSYPMEAVAGEPIAVTLGVGNHERGDIEYRIERLDDAGSERIATVQLSHEQSWQQPYTFALNQPGANQKVEFLLYRGDQVEPYRSLHLWITVKGKR